MKHKACTIQIHLTWMNHSHDPCLRRIFLVLILLGLICTSDCRSWILAFTVAKHDTTSTNDAFDFSIFWTSSIKTTTNDCKCLNVLNRIRSENFQKNVSEQQLACRWTWSMNLKLGTIDASLASCAKVIATWLRYEKYVFGTQYPQSRNSPFHPSLRTVQMQSHVIRPASK